MNKQDRQQLATAIEHLNSAREILELLKDQEQEKFDNLSEGLQQSEKGQKFEENANTLSEAYDNVESAIDSLEGIE